MEVKDLEINRLKEEIEESNRLKSIYQKAAKGNKIMEEFFSYGLKSLNMKEICSSVK